MKKVLISALQLHKNSGSALTVFEHIKYFKGLGMEVHVASMTMNKSKLLEMGVHPHKMLPWFKSTGLMRRRWYNYQFQRLKRSLKPDLTIGHGDILDQDVLTLHNSVFLASDLINKRPLNPKSEMAILHGEILNNKKFKIVIANSLLMKNDLIKRFNIPDNQIRVIYPGLDKNIFFQQSIGQRDLLRKTFGFPDKVIVALVTSGNFKKRGLDRFVETINNLPASIKEKADFRIIGKDNIDINLGPSISHDQTIDNIQDYYNALDVFVLPAYIEEFGRVVLEAMGCGLPVITTSEVGASEIITGESRRFILSPYSSSSFSNSLKELILSSGLRSRIGALNLQAAINSSNELQSKLDETFQEVLTGNKARTFRTLKRA